MNTQNLKCNSFWTEKIFVAALKKKIISAKKIKSFIGQNIQFYKILTIFVTTKKKGGGDGTFYFTPESVRFQLIMSQFSAHIYYYYTYLRFQKMLYFYTKSPYTYINLSLI